MGDRTVTVDLALEIGRYLSSASRVVAANETLDASFARLDGSVDDTSIEMKEFTDRTEAVTVSTKKVKPSLDDAADAVDGVGDKARVSGEDVKGFKDDLDDLGEGADRTAGELGHLDRGIEQARLALIELAREFDRTGDKTLIKSIAGTKADLANLQAIRKELAGIIEPKSGLNGFAAGNFASAADAVRHFDVEIERLTGHLGGLHLQYARTADANVFKQIGEAKKDLGALREIRKEISGMVSGGMFDGAKGFAGIGSALASNPYVAAAGVVLGGGIVASAATFIGSATAGLLLGAAAVGAVAGGVALAAQDPKVHLAGAELAETVMGGLKASASPFIEPTVAAIGLIGQAWEKSLPQVEKAFGAASRYVLPLTEGLTQFVENMLPGITSGLENAGPVIDQLKFGLAEMGKSIGDLFENLGEHSDEAAAGLQALFGTLNAFIDFSSWALGGLASGFGHFVDWGGQVSGVLEDWVGWMPLLGDHMGRLNDVFERLNGTAQGETFSHLGGRIGGVSTAAEVAAQSAISFELRQKLLNGSLEEGIRLAGGLAQAFKILNGDAISTREAHAAFEASLDKVSEALKKNGNDLRLTTDAGRANDAVLVGIAKSTMTLADAKFKEIEATQGTGAAIAAAMPLYEQGRQELIRAYMQFDNNRARAEAYANAIMKIPPTWATTIIANMTPAEQAIEAVRRMKIGDKTFWITAQYREIRNVDSEGRATNEQMNARLNRRAEGGPVEKGRTYWVGELGPELVTFGDSGYVHTAANSRKMTMSADQPLMRGYAGLGGGAGGGRTEIVHRLIVATETGRVLLDRILDSGFASALVEMRRTGDLPSLA